MRTTSSASCRSAPTNHALRSSGFVAPISSLIAYGFASDPDDSSLPLGRDQGTEANVAAGCGRPVLYNATREPLSDRNGRERVGGW